MKVRRSIVAAGAAVVLGTTGALVLPAVANAHDAVHTLKYIAVANKTIAFTSTTFGIQDTDVNGTGKIIGFDDVYVTVTGRTRQGGTRRSTSRAASFTSRSPLPTAARRSVAR